MRIELIEISKRYTHVWVLKKVSHVFPSGGIYGIKGSNGSGKSTIMQIISGQLSPTLGKIDYISEKPLSSDEVHSNISFAAPYITPLENLSLKETFDFHRSFRRFKNDLSFDAFCETLEYPYKKDQLIKYYSSGMAQRLSLALTVLSESELILLDEPTSYLDEEAKQWYYNLLKEYRMNTTTIISSNDQNDLTECSSFITL